MPLELGWLRGRLIESVCCSLCALLIFRLLRLWSGLREPRSARDVPAAHARVLQAERRVVALPRRLLEGGPAVRHADGAERFQGRADDPHVRSRTKNIGAETQRENKKERSEGCISGGPDSHRRQRLSLCPPSRPSRKDLTARTSSTPACTERQGLITQLPQASSKHFRLLINPLSEPQLIVTVGHSFFILSVMFSVSMRHIK